METVKFVANLAACCPSNIDGTWSPCCDVAPSGAPTPVNATTEEGKDEEIVELGGIAPIVLLISGGLSLLALCFCCATAKVFKWALKKQALKHEVQRLLQTNKIQELEEEVERQKKLNKKEKEKIGRMSSASPAMGGGASASAPPRPRTSRRSLRKFQHAVRRTIQKSRGDGPGATLSPAPGPRFSIGKLKHAVQQVEQLAHARGPIRRASVSDAAVAMIEHMRDVEEHAFAERQIEEEEARHRIEEALAVKKKHSHARHHTKNKGGAGAESGGHHGRSRRKIGRSNTATRRKSNSAQSALNLANTGVDTGNRRGSAASHELVSKMREVEEHAFEELHNREEAERVAAERSLARKKHRSHRLHHTSSQAARVREGHHAVVVRPMTPAQKRLLAAMAAAPGPPEGDLRQRKGAKKKKKGKRKRERPKKHRHKVGRGTDKKKHNKKHHASKQKAAVLARSFNDVAKESNRDELAEVAKKQRERQRDRTQKHIAKKKEAKEKKKKKKHHHRHTHTKDRHGAGRRTEATQPALDATHEDHDDAGGEAGAVVEAVRRPSLNRTRSGTVQFKVSDLGDVLQAATKRQTDVFSNFLQGGAPDNSGGGGEHGDKSKHKTTKSADGKHRTKKSHHKHHKKLQQQQQQYHDNAEHNTQGKPDKHHTRPKLQRKRSGTVQFQSGDIDAALSTNAAADSSGNSFLERRAALRNARNNKKD